MFPVLSRVGRLRLGGCAGGRPFGKLRVILNKSKDEHRSKSRTRISLKASGSDHRKGLDLFEPVLRLICNDDHPIRQTPIVSLFPM